MRFLQTAGWVLLAALAATPQCVAAQEQHNQAALSQKDLVINGERVRVIQHVGGSLCVVCGEPIHAHEPVYLINGQRVPLHGPGSACDAVFRKDPAKFLAALQPRGAFLGGEPSQVSFGWFVFGSYVLLGLVFAGLCGQAALNRGLAPMPWYLGGFFFNVFAYVAVLLKRGEAMNAPAGVPGGLGKIAATYAPTKCVCGAENHPSASQCSTCGRALTPTVSSEVSRVAQG